MSFVTRKEQGLTLVEVLVVTMVIAIFACLLIPAQTKNKARSLRIQCVNNLKQAGLAFRIWGGCDDKYIMAVSTNRGGTMEFASGPNAFRHFLGMSNELSTPKVLVCPTDSRRIQATTFSPNPLPGENPFMSNSNLSYFVGLDATETDPQTLLSGDRNLSNGTPLKNGVLELTTKNPATWIADLHRKVGNVLLADGSVQQESALGVSIALTNTFTFTNRLLLPVLSQ